MNSYRSTQSPGHSKKMSNVSLGKKSGSNESESNYNLGSNPNLDLTGSIFPSLGKPKHHILDSEGVDQNRLKSFFYQ